ncbi:MAG: Mur ligase domain-containing protein, partial [Microcoleus sp.]
MVCRVTVAQLAEILSVPLPAVSDRVLTETLSEGITPDTRLLKGGEVFLALRGEYFDGHEFIEKARDLGAIAAVADRAWQGEVPDFPILRVDDT